MGSMQYGPARMADPCTSGHRARKAVSVFKLHFCCLVAVSLFCSKLCLNVVMHDVLNMHMVT